MNIIAREMTISEKHKFVFVEVGSTGSTAIRNVLNQYRDVKVEVSNGYHYNVDSEKNPAHIAIWALENELPLETFYKFAFFSGNLKPSVTVTRLQIKIF